MQRKNLVFFLIVIFRKADRSPTEGNGHNSNPSCIGTQREVSKSCFDGLDRYRALDPVLGIRQKIMSPPNGF